jgi:hypothetical protein
MIKKASCRIGCDRKRSRAIETQLARDADIRDADQRPAATRITIRPHDPRTGAEPTRYSKLSADAAAIEALFVDLFLDTHRRAPER